MPTKQQILEETIKKSSLTAENAFDYAKILTPRTGFIPMSWKEEKEVFLATYQIGGLTPLAELKARSDREEMLAVLISAADLEASARRMAFSLDPDNVYVNANWQALVKHRDVYNTGFIYQPGDFIKKYKALIGHCLQSQYQYGDYINGGLSLMESDPFLKEVAALSSAAEIQACLGKARQTLLENRRATERVVDRKRYTTVNVVMWVCLACLIVSAGLLGYMGISVVPYQKAVMAADNCYIENDSVGLIDALEKVSVSRMDKHQKYILASAYIKSENLNQEQKNNLLSNLSLQENEANLEYWIYLGRLDTEKAEDIAMQQSDDQLLLYAYLKEKSTVETDTKMTGDEKTAKLSALDEKIKPLKEKYSGVQ